MMIDVDRQQTNEGGALPMFRLLVSVFGPSCSYTATSMLLFLYFLPESCPALISTMAVKWKFVCLDKLYNFSMNDAPFDELRRSETAMVMVLDAPLPGLHILDPARPSSSSAQQVANVASLIFLIWRQTPSALQ
jgi:hypothetical protein